MLPGVLSRGIGFFLLPLYTRILSPADYGVFDLFVIVGGFVSLTVAMEISQAIARFYPDAKKTGQGPHYASTGLWFSVLMYGLFLCVALPFSRELSLLISGVEGYEVAFRLALAYFFVNGVFLYVQSQLRWDLKSRQFAVTSMIVTVVTTVTSVFLAWFLSMGLSGILLGMISGVLLGGGYGLFQLRGTFFPYMNAAMLKEMLSFSLPLVPSGIFVFITYYADRIMINHYLGLDEVGIYGVGFRIASVIGLLIAGFQGALTPLVFNSYKNPETPSHIATIFQIFVALSLVIFTGLSLFAQEALVLMTTEPFYAAAPLVPLMVSSALLSAMYVFAPGISIAKKTHLIVWINLIAACINILMNVIFIPIWGVLGAAFSTFFANCAIFIMYMYFSQKYYTVPHDWRRIITVAALCGTIVLILAAFLPSEFSLSIFLVKISALVSVLFILYWSRIVDVGHILDVWRRDAA